MAGITRRAAGLATLGVLAAGGARAQAWPSRPLRIIVPFPGGNAGDITARVIGEEIAKRISQPVVVENRAGASGALGIQAVLAAPADGHTLLVAAPDFPANDLAGVIRELQANPGKHSFANLGPGTLSHLTQEQFRVALGLNFEGVPYRGSGQALMDVSAGRIGLMFDGMTSSLAQVQGGRVKPIAVSSRRRSTFAPEVPTLAESGDPRLAAFEAVGWTGMLAPRATPAAVVERLNAVVNEALRDPALVRRFGAQALETYPPGSPAAFAAYIRADIERWQKVVRDAGIQVTN